MGTEKSALKRSFFREYFFYKLRGTLGIGIASAILGFISCILSGIITLSYLKGLELNNDISGDGSLPFLAMFGGLVGMTVLALVTPIVSFKYYRSRSFMDTLGCLPITYGERFWGDYLSGLAAIVAPFSVMAAIGGIPLVMAQPIINRVKDIGKAMSTLDNSDKSFLLFGIRMYFVMLIIIVAAYSITTLVVSCCGKAGSSALYSVIALPIIPAVIALYGMFTLNNTKGILPEQYINTILSCFPPVGTFIYLTYDLRNIGYYSESKFTVIPNAAMVIVSLLFIAAMIAAAYFIGKRRKTERVGNSFVVDAMYHILTLLMVLAVIGVYFSTNRILGIDLTKVIIGAVIALVFYLILELIQYRNFKTIWKSLIRYACVAVVGFGFLIIAMQTHGFGIGTHLPNQNDIEEITIESRDFGNNGGVGTITYRAENAISAILAENQRLIDNYDKTSTGSGVTNDNELDFTYSLKNGKTVTRYYRINDDSLRGDVVEEIKKQPTYEIGLLGVLNRDDLTGIKMTFTPYDDYRNPQNENAGNIKDSKIPELVERLKYDIINSESDHGDIGILSATLPKGEEDESIDDYDMYFKTHWFISKTYTRTIEFLNNPDNYIEKKSEDPNAPADKVKLYRVSYQFFRADESEPSPAVTSATVKFRSDSDSEYAKELMSYFVSGSIQGDDIYFYVRVLDVETEWYVDDESFYIPKENQDAALKAMMNLIAEQVAEM